MTGAPANAIPQVGAIASWSAGRQASRCGVRVDLNYNTCRLHSSLDKMTPDEFYFATLPAIKQAA